MAALWAFPVALWLVATGWHGFDIGKYSDDWAISLRTPETDAYAWPASPFLRWDYFWRPLHLIAVYGFATLFWHHDWVNHAISALAHLGVGVLLYRLLRRCDVRVSGAMGGMCVFLVFPISFEAVLWPAALGSVVGVGWFLLVAHLCIGRARATSDLRAAARWVWLIGLALLGFTIACWHEQPAACVLALPAMFLATGGGAGKSILQRAAAATAACGVGVAAYVALFVASVPAGRRGGSNTLVRADSLPNRLMRLIDMSWDLSLGARARDTAMDGMEIGIGAMFRSPMGIALCVGLVGLAVAHVVLMVGASRLKSCEPVWNGTPVRYVWLAIFGLVAAAASLAPIALVTWQPMHPRYFYGVGMGVSVALVAAIECMIARSSRPRSRNAFTLGIASLIALVSLFGAAACVGLQVQLRARWRADVDQMEQLRRLVPNPPRDAVFVPLEIADGRARGLRPSDPGLLGAIAQPWSCWAYVQRGYSRSDVSATHVRHGQHVPIVIHPAGIGYPRGVCDRWGRSGSAGDVVPWDRVVAFAIDERGIVRLLTREEVMRRRGGAAPSPE